MKAVCVVVLSSLVLFPGSYAGAENVSFLDAFDMASDSALEVNLARYRAEVADSRRDVAFGSILPQITLFGQWSENRLRYDLPGAESLPAYPGQRYGIQIRQALLNVGDSLEVRRLDSLYRQSEEELALAYNQLLVALADAYFKVTITSAERVVVLDELNALENQYLQAKALSDKNLTPVTETLETLARRDSVKADIAYLDGKFGMAKESLYALVGDRNITTTAIADKVALPEASISLDEALSLAAERNPNISVAEEALSAAREATRREKSSWIPDVELNYTFQHSDVGFDNLQSAPRDTSIITLSVNYPIFEGGAGSARLRGAWAEYYSAMTRLQFAKRDVEARVRTSWLNKAAATRRVDAAVNAAVAARTSYEATAKAVHLGTARASDALLALASRSAAKMELNRAILEQVLAWIEFELSIGEPPHSVAAAVSSAIHEKQ